MLMISVLNVMLGVGAAPNFFVIENGHAYVFAQPTNEKEIAECQEALAGCPVSSINVNS